MNITIVDRGSKIPVTNYGGTERVIWGLGYELQKLGHKITFVVSPGSSCDFADVIDYDPGKSLNSLIPKDTNLVHMNFVPEPGLSFPYLITMHGNLKKGKIVPLNTVFISLNHARRNNSEVFVHNGLLWGDYPSIDLNLSRNYLHFLGKASWKVKNLAGAAEIAIKSKNNLHVLGGDKWKMYNVKRKPIYTLHPTVNYHGLTENIEKMEIMQHSKGLLFPVLWDEPFGLAIIESLYAGCPVFGTKRGSLPELINEQVGFLSDDTAEIIEAIKTKEFNPQVCHDYAVQHFSAEVMTSNYLKLYDKILRGETLNKIPPYAS